MLNQDVTAHLLALGLVAASVGRPAQIRGDTVAESSDLQTIWPLIAIRFKFFFVPYMKHWSARRSSTLMREAAADGSPWMIRGGTGLDTSHDSFVPLQHHRLPRSIMSTSLNRPWICERCMWAVPSVVKERAPWD